MTENMQLMMVERRAWAAALPAFCLLLFWMTVPAVAETPAAGWTETGTLAAPEAFQAAAAEGRFVYAIASRQIAKYDRSTGQRVAVSTGEAKHLNSGFFHDGKLYCAHSNYPQTPEQSQIRVLDVDTMELSTAHDFQDYGGSLTWVLRRDGHWWCNFARYGEQNGKTFFAKFDDDWKELARWTYPAEVIAQLGRYSLSGGVWDGDELLVTGHDDPVLFRLRLPEKGNVLEFIGSEAAPFSGQGIAHDPVTGGLVGIRRAAREVVFAAAPASEPLRLRVLSYNIHHAEGVDGKLDLERIAGVIRAVEPDLVALQEVDSNVRRSESVDQPAELARLTGMEGVFGGNIELQGGGYGNAVLSRLPIVRHENHRLPRFDNGEQRGVLEVEVTLPGDRGRLLLLATHFDHRRNERERIASAEAINRMVAKRSGLPALLAGDLNALPESETLRVLGRQWTRSNAEVQPTFPAQKPNRQIDYVLFRPEGRWKVVETKVLDESVASDHRAFLAVLELRNEPRP
ncbi:endonuclease/exonuclease/phosphatase family protein [Maioricimonas sp. JC845]|uniref:endonuclease/exonuclease/phosphatase family protein n=1 Tax=Maioricimonas sp. JC845 TaxID=3232138 RepID=UPI00345A42F3